MPTATAPADLHQLLRPLAKAAITADQLRDPPAAYRGTPFWSWNCRLDRDRLLGQFARFADMGMGGAHLHSRVGLATEYLGEEFLGHVKAVADLAAKKGMLAWLYDEDRWPSGFAGGLVTADEAYRNKYLVVTTRPYDGKEMPPAGRTYAARTNRGREIARWAVRLVDGYLAAHRRLAADQQAGADETLWIAYFDVAPTSAWFNHAAYVDVMDPKAIRRFIEVTHEAYAKAVGGHFGRTIPAIFTDEPHITPSGVKGEPADGKDVILPWTGDFSDTYRAAWNEDLLDHLPELIWELPEGRVSPRRWRFRDHLSERFASAFADQIGAWCADHGIALTGHLMSEPTLDGQISNLGEAMRHYRGFQLPGIDLLCDRLEFTTAKQAVSVSRQDGRAGALSELYGVTNWDFDLAAHKRQGDWQAALGITVRVHHLAWVSMRGDAKRDYPGAIGPQATFVDDYRQVEDHFARVNLLLTRGAARVRVAVVHPVESQWLDLGPESQTGGRRGARERQFQDLTSWLVHGLIDFDFVAESLLEHQQARSEGAAFRVGAMAYDAVILPDLRTVRASTLERLVAFSRAGGRLLIMGRAPTLVNALPDGRVAELVTAARLVPSDEWALLEALEDLREVDVRVGNRRADGVVHQVRVDGDGRILFLANSQQSVGKTNPWSGGPSGARVRVRGVWRVVEVDTLSGCERPRAVRYQDGWTELDWDCPSCGSLLLRLMPGRDAVTEEPRVSWREIARLDDPVTVTRDEPNVLLLDRAEWSLDGGAWQPACDTLLVTDRVRRDRGWDPMGGNVPQPWTLPEDSVGAPVRLRHRIVCEVVLTGLRLAIEDPKAWTLTVDGRSVATTGSAWWIDEDIRTVVLPDLAAGEHVIEAARGLARRDTLEWFHLLGDFGVRLAGSHARLIAPPRELAWGDWCQQGLPFYAGSVTYHARLSHSGGRLALRIPHRSGALVRVALDGVSREPIWLPPWRCDLGEVAAGEHRLDLTLVGHRGNALGAVHVADPGWRWWGPPSWFLTGDSRTESYRLWPLGITGEPVIER